MFLIFFELIFTLLQTNLITLQTSLLLLLSTFTSIGLSWNASTPESTPDSTSEGAGNLFLVLPVVLVLAHHLIYDKAHMVGSFAKLFITRQAPLQSYLPDHTCVKYCLPGALRQLL